MSYKQIYAPFIFLLFLLGGCASSSESFTPDQIDSNSKKAKYIPANGDIIWKQKVYSRHWLTRRYDAKELFNDKKSAQELIEESNDYQVQSGKWITSSLYLALITYVVASQIDPKYQGLSLWMLVGFGIIPPLHLQLKAQDAAEQAVEEYNEKMVAPAPGISYSWGF